MMDENVYVAPDRKRYRAEKAPKAGTCIGCAFVGKSCDGAECRPHLRADHRSVIWVPDDAPAPMAELTAEPAFPGTLRDWFAGMALQGFVASAFKYTVDESSDTATTPAALRLMKDIGTVSYQIADAMMKARDEARP